MIDALYWWDEAVKFKESARVAEDEPTQLEFIELAKICEDVAAKLEERSTGG